MTEDGPKTGEGETYNQWKWVRPLSNFIINSIEILISLWLLKKTGPESAPRGTHSPGFLNRRQSIIFCHYLNSIN